MKEIGFFVAVWAFVVLPPSRSWPFAQATGHVNIPYVEARSILDTLRADLIPAELRTVAPAEREALWPDWVARRDADIRARLAAGDEDSVITFLLFGVSFTTQPRYSFAAAAAQRSADAVSADPVVEARIRDLAARIAFPGVNERLQFARRVIERHGVDVTSTAGRRQAEQVLRDALRRMLADYDAYFRDSSPGATLFRNRGLSSDTSIYAAFAIDAALKDIAASRVLRPGSVRRVAVVGPGLDFTDKQEGYDFYPLQTIQPFAVIDSLRAYKLAAADGVQMITYDLNPRVNDHIEAARQRARRGTGYTVQLPRDPTERWQRALVSYWTRFGDSVGEHATPVTPPPAAGRVDVRAVRIRPDVVQAITSRDLNIILQRPDPLPESERVDLVIATNILIYYDVFEQALAATNIARMLHSGALLVTNNPLFELPAIPLRQIGETKAAYTDAGFDFVAWYQRE